MEKWGQVTARRMFGGHGLYCEGLMFALVADHSLYLKVDDQNRPDFEALGCTPFTYTLKDKPMALSYWSAPEAMFDDPSEAVRWARLAWDAAARGQRAKVQARERAQAKLASRKKKAASTLGKPGSP